MLLSTVELMTFNLIISVQVETPLVIIIWEDVFIPLMICLGYNR